MRNALAVAALACSGCFELTVVPNHQVVALGPDAFDIAGGLHLAARIKNRRRVPVRICDGPLISASEILKNGRPVTSGNWVQIQRQDYAAPSFPRLKAGATAELMIDSLSKGGRDDLFYDYAPDGPGTYSVRFEYHCREQSFSRRALSNWVRIEVSEKIAPPKNVVPVEW